MLSTTSTSQKETAIEVRAWLGSGLVVSGIVSGTIDVHAIIGSIISEVKVGKG